MLSLRGCFWRPWQSRASCRSKLGPRLGGGRFRHPQVRLSLSKPDLSPPSPFDKLRVTEDVHFVRGGRPCPPRFSLRKKNGRPEGLPVGTLRSYAQQSCGVPILGQRSVRSLATRSQGVQYRSTHPVCSAFHPSSPDEEQILPIGRYLGIKIVPLPLQHAVQA
jgi:hypothetical protein